MTDPDAYAIPSAGVSMTSGDLHVDAMNVPLGDPFNGDCIELTVTKKVDLGQLSTEIQRRTKTKVMLAMRCSPDDAPPTDVEPYVLWVSPGSVNEKAVQQVLDRHVPVLETMPNAPEVTQGVTATAITPSFDANQQALVDRLQAGEQLNAAESSNLLRAILGISS